MNPLLNIGAPPDDAEGQIEWLANALRTLESTKDGKLRPLKKRLARLMFQFQRAVDREEDPAIAAQRFQPEIQALIAETFRSLAKTLEQIVGTMRVKRARGQFQASPADFSRLVTEIQAGAAQFSKFAEAVYTRDEKKVREAQRRLGQAAERLKDPIAAVA